MVTIMMATQLGWNTPEENVVEGPVGMNLLLERFQGSAEEEDLEVLMHLNEDLIIVFLCQVGLKKFT